MARIKKITQWVRKNPVALLGVLVLVVAGMAAMQLTKTPPQHSEISSQSRKTVQRYTPTAAEWASITVAPAVTRTFRSELITEGKIAVDEDRSTPVFSPYAGRVTKLLARPGETVTQGQPLLVLEAADNVGVQNDFIAAVTGLNKAKSQLELADIQNKRAQDLSAGRAIPLKDYQTAQAALITAQNDMRTAETALEAARNRLRILGLTDDDITTFQTKGIINRETTIYAPLAGTVVQRKVGPGQYIAANSSDPIFVIGNLSTVWVLAYVRETEADAVEVGEEMNFTALALPGRKISGRINYVAAALDPTTRRLLARATIDNPNGQLKPEMFANVTIYSTGDHPAVGVPKQALIYEGSAVRLWVALDDKTIELRQIKTGLTNGEMVEVASGLEPGEKIVTRGSLFIDRAASSGS